MKIRATTNQLGLAPMRIPKTRASWIDPVPIHTHGGRRTQGRALTRRLTGYASSVPPPHAPTRERAPVGQARPLLRRDPRADRRDHRGRTVNIAALEKRAQARDDRTWCRGSWPPSTPRPPSPTSTSPRRRWCSPAASTARRRDGRPQGRRRSAVDALRRTDGDDGSALAASRSTPPSSASRTQRRQALRRRQARRHAATPSRLVAGYADAAADNVITAIERLHRPRPTATARRPTSASPALESRDQAHDASIIGALALLAALGLAVGLARHLGRRLRASRAPPRRSPRATSTTSSPSGPRRGRAHRRRPGHDGRAPPRAGRRRRPRGRGRPDRRRVSRAPSATASAPPSPASWPSCAPP